MWSLAFEGSKETVRDLVLNAPEPLLIPTDKGGEARASTFNPEDESPTVADPLPPGDPVETAETETFRFARDQVIALIDRLSTNGVRVHAAGDLDRIIVFIVEGRVLSL